jgi:hypothetical protein
MTSQITEQLAATKLNDPSSEANWKEGLTAPAKDARPQTEVSICSTTCIGVLSRAYRSDNTRTIAMLEPRPD